MAWPGRSRPRCSGPASRREDLGYINAHGSGTGQSDPAETNALRLALGDAVGRVPVSSTKSLHGQSLEASGVLELIVTLLAARKGMLPVNAGFLGTDDSCRLNLVLGEALARHRGVRDEPQRRIRRREHRARYRPAMTSPASVASPASPRCPRRRPRPA